MNRLHSGLVRQRVWSGLMVACLSSLFITSATNVARATELPVVATGRLIDAAGNGISGGQVLLYLSDPTQSTQALTSAVSDATGGFSMALDPASVNSLAAANGGYVNFDVVVTASGVFSVTGIAREFVAKVWRDEWTSSPAMPAITVSVGAPGASLLKTSTSVSSRVAPCSGQQKVLMSTSNAYTTVGEFHAANDTTGFLRYGKSADSDVGVGVSTDGTNWSISGSYHIGNSQNGYAQWDRGPKYGRRDDSLIQYGKYKWVSCLGVIQSYEVDAQTWGGGATDGTDNSSFDYQCGTTYSAYKVDFAVNTHFERSANRAVTFNGAVSVYGASLTAQSGYSTYVVSHWNFGSNQVHHYLCGNNDFPTYSLRVFAGL